MNAPGQWKRFNRGWTWTAGVATAVVIPLYAWKVFQKRDYTDFSVYWRAASRFAGEQWQDIYTLADGASPFRYAPITLPLFRPFALASLPAAQLFWYFIQLLCFGAGFALLYGTLKRSKQTRDFAPGLTALSLLFVLRFCLDTFTIGQVSSVMFLGFSIALFGWVYRFHGLAGAGLFVPTLLKIGPGFLFGLFTLQRPRARLRSLAAAGALFVLLNLLTAIAVGGRETFLLLWSRWKFIVAQDSVYYDASHYGSQSLNSFLLRSAKSGWLPPDWTGPLHLGTALIVCTVIAVFWLLRRPKRPLGRALFFCLGLFPFLWFMPETFKYALTALAFPFAFLAGLVMTRPREHRFEAAALGAGVLTLTLAGRDIVQNTIFMGLQNASIPFFVTVWLGAAVGRQAWRHSQPSPLLRTLQSILAMRTLGPWTHLPAENITLEGTFLVPVRLDATDYSHEPVERARTLTRDLCEFARRRGLEVLFLPYGSRLSAFHPVLRAIEQELAGGDATLFRILMPHAESPDGRGSVLREGFLASRGRRILVLHFEQPCELRFFDEALAAFETGEGVELVRANRRHAASRFRIPVSLLPLVYRRHQLGLLFNRLVRWALPVTTTDTHAGTLVMSRALATRVFAFQTSPDFLFDLEISLTAQAGGCHQVDLPVTLYLAREKKTVRMFHETLHILFGLPLLAARYRKGCYGQESLLRPEWKFTADDWGISPAVNDGILQLVRDGVLSRVSLMADSRYLTDGLSSLLELQKAGRVSLGLHFNLTYGKRFSSPGAVLLAWFRNRELARWVREEFDSQLAKLRSSGVQVQYLDGHHHIHMVPGLFGKVLAPALRETGIREVRLPYDARLWFSARFALNAMALLARPALIRSGFRFRNFRYPSQREFLDPGRFLCALDSRGTELEVIVHPASGADPEKWEYDDPYISPRVTEFRTLRVLGHVLRKGPV